MISSVVVALEFGAWVTTKIPLALPGFDWHHDSDTHETGEGLVNCCE